MNSTHRLTIAAVLIAVAAIAAGAMFHATQSARAESEVSPSAGSMSEPMIVSVPAVPVPTPNYTVRPGDTDGTPAGADGNQPDCPGPGIGCDDEQWELDGNELPSPWGEGAINVEHLFYLPPSSTDKSKLLVFLGGGNGGGRGGESIGPVAAQLGYHVISLTYPAARANSCSEGDDTQKTLDCFGNAFREVVFGVNSPNPGGDKTNVGQHPQDSLVNRLLRVLQWAAANKSGDGWGRYLTDKGEVDWRKIHLAGMSNGSSHSSFMGTLEQFRDVGRVALFAGPDDGDGGSTEDTWMPATYIQESEGLTGSRYYGLVHVLNKAPDPDHPRWYRIAKNWTTFGMEFPLNGEGVFFDPIPGATPDFGGAHMLISTNPTTDYIEAHESVAHDRECSEYGPDENGKIECKAFEGDVIGYEPAWRCILGTGDEWASTRPSANAGPNLTVECEGSGGAKVALDGSASRDINCDALTYTWTGSFGTATGRNPTIFLPVGTHLVTLVVKDGWSSSDPTTVSITVQDTQPPSLNVILTPTELWPANHELIRIDATVSAADSCGGPAPQVVLTSITSDQPDNGSGDGDKADDIQDAAFGTFDLSFLLRAERAGGDKRGRTYTVTYTATDASGNSTQRTTTVHVPH